MSRVHILATSCAIAEIAAPEIDQDYPAMSGTVEVDVEQVVRAAPDVCALASLEVESFAPLARRDVDEYVWTRLAARINGLFATDAADAVVITHDADTIEETAYYLHLVVKSNRPVVLTCLPRSASSLGCDCPRNLYNAIAVATDGRTYGRGAILAVNDNLHSARDVTTVSSTDTQTFASPGRGLLGIVTLGHIRYFRRPTRCHTAETQFSADLSERLPRVDILYSHVDMSVDLVSACVSLGASGIVIAGVGNGNVPCKVARELAEVAKHGMIIVRSSRVESGDAMRERELDGKAMNLVAADRLNPQKSRVLLQLCLAKGMDRDAIRQAFRRY